MRNFLIPTKTINVVLRLAPLALPAILAGGIAVGCGPQTPQGGPGPQGAIQPLGSPGPQAPQAGPAPQASQSGMLGTWRTHISSGTITMTFLASGIYNQIGVTTTGVQEGQGGPYQLVAPNTIILSVTDWSPKSHMVLIPCGIPGDPTCNVRRIVANPKPSGSTYAYTFNGPNTMIFNNEQAQETITFTRVSAQ
jgi:hypothetical protein